MNKSKIYTLIAYTPSIEGWHNRCGDYERGKDSQLYVDSFIDHESIGIKIGQLKFEDNETLFTLLINGIDVDAYSDFLTKEEQESYMNESDLIYEISNKEFYKLEQEKKHKLEEDYRIKKQIEELNARKAQEQLEQRERAQLALLMHKYNK